MKTNLLDGFTRLEFDENNDWVELFIYDSFNSFGINIHQTMFFLKRENFFIFI